MKHRPEPVGFSTLFLVLFVCAMWGGNVAAVKVSLAALAPIWAAWWRMALGLVVVVGWALRGGTRLLPSPEDRRPLITLGLLFSAQIGLLNLGTDRTSPAYAVVLLSAHPLFTNVLGHFAAHEHRLSAPRIAGIVVAFSGICFLALGRPVVSLARDPITGNLLLIASAFLLGIRNVYTRRVVQFVEPVKVVVWMMAVCLPVFLVPALLFEPPLAGPLTIGPVAALAYQSIVVAGYCFVTWAKLLRRHAAGTLSMLAFTIPFFGVIISAALFSEPITARILIAAGLVTAGIALVGRG